MLSGGAGDGECLEVQADLSHLRVPEVLVLVRTGSDLVARPQADERGAAHAQFADDPLDPLVLGEL
ncbi:hypothetical protein ADK86_29300 [Streptomyces sp. NRRL F-5755]|nr:hypothetical protein ADK86_29300 [Streptomyces sp. NRRL F-5755]